MELKTRGFALSSRPRSESDRLVRFFTLHAGCVWASVRGARKHNSKLASSLELMSESDLVLYRKGGSDFHRLVQAKLLSGHANLKKDLASITMLQVLSDVLGQSIPDGEGNTGCYALVLEVLSTFREAGSAAEKERVFISFAFKLLDLLGYPAELSVCSECGSSLERGPAILIAHRGGALCRTCAPGNSPLHLQPAHRAILEKLASWPLSRTRVLKTTPHLSRELFKTVLGYLEATFEHPLRSFPYYLQVVPLDKKG